MWIGLVGQSCAGAGVLGIQKKPSIAANAAVSFLIGVPSRSRTVLVRDCSEAAPLDKAPNDANNARKTGGAAMSTNMSTKTLSPEAMEKRVARFSKLQSYQTQNFDAHGIPPGAVEKITARKVFPVMAPADYQGRSAGAPVKGPRGLIVTIAECEAGNGPGLHRHLNTVENFMCLTGRFEIAWGDNGEHKLVLDPLDMISVPRGENRSFRNVSNEPGRLLVMIVPETDEQVDPISYAPSLAKEIEAEYGKGALEGLQKIGFKFEEPAV